MKKLNFKVWVLQLTIRKEIYVAKRDSLYHDNFSLITRGGLVIDDGCDRLLRSGDRFVYDKEPLALAISLVKDKISLKELKSLEEKLNDDKNAVTKNNRPSAQQNIQQDENLVDILDEYYKE